MKKSILMSALIGTALLSTLSLELTAGQCGGKMKEPDANRLFPPKSISLPHTNPANGEESLAHAAKEANVEITVEAVSTTNSTNANNQDAPPPLPPKENKQKSGAEKNLDKRGQAPENCNLRHTVSREDNRTPHSLLHSPQALDELTKMAEGLSNLDMKNLRFTKIIDSNRTQTPLPHVVQTKTRGVFTNTPNTTPKVSRKPALSTPREETAEEINLDVVPETKPLAVPKRIQRPGRSNLTRAKSVDENQNNVPPSKRMGHGADVLSELQKKKFSTQKF